VPVGRVVVSRFEVSSINKERVERRKGFHIFRRNPCQREKF
jgi:hypothetical protein